MLVLLSTGHRWLNTGSGWELDPLKMTEPVLIQTKMKHPTARPLRAP